ncbi:MAG: hypothetical protein ACI9BS_000923 [Candidatus Poriferisodalaceae bacterium]|jgi:hypothetical protein|tara:strand:+ start:3855 stop:4250 length:396 start_codon:yes stop_codon:yes gene_type:complete
MAYMNTEPQKEASEWGINNIQPGSKRVGPPSELPPIDMGWLTPGYEPTKLSYSPQPQILSEEVDQTNSAQMQAANRSRRKASKRAKFTNTKQSKVTNEVYSPIKTDTGMKRGVVVLVLLLIASAATTALVF